jgi:tetratricopeptide (TPR) repeat protein/serine/threonine protein kinase
MNEAPAVENLSLESLVAQLADDFREQRERGEHPAVEQYVQRFPQFEPVIRNLLASLELIRLSSQGSPAAVPLSAADAPLAGCLGDYRLLAEVGRGGMGVVYEAEQLSLSRRVALKVLPFASTLDPKQLQRFKNEAQAAAHLHHQSIVPVYATGCERGVHFYAMQFIEGQTLAQVIADLRQAAEPRPSGSGGRLGDQTTAYTPLPEGGGPDPTAARAALSTERSVRSAAHCQLVARLGVQAAEALEHAHQLGVVHRDIKPANLLVDRRSNLWITDFGLALCQHQAGLTMSGDLVGTLRYMSPEQALAQRALVDHRTDLYSLGATLYELLTLEPAFGGKDRQELLRQIAFEGPKPPRRLNRAVPAELETIVGKAMEKDPADRYATAQELADDLERFLKDEPIRAMRPTLVQRSRKWVRRHKAAVWAAVVCLSITLIVLGVSIGWAMRDRAARRAKAAYDVELALDRAELFQGQGKRAEALAALDRVELLAGEAGPDPDRDVRVATLKEWLDADARDQEFIVRWEEIRLRETDRVNVQENRFVPEAAFPALREALGRYGIAIGDMAPAQAAACVQGRPEPVRSNLVNALEACLGWAPNEDLQTRQWVLAALEAADNDPWRLRLRKAVVNNDWKALEQLAPYADMQKQPPGFLLRLANSLPVQMRTTRLELSRRIQRAYPAHLWANLHLADELIQTGQIPEAIRYYTAALALRPHNPGIYLNRGIALKEAGEVDAAIADFRQSLALAPQYAAAHDILGLALYAKGRLDEGIAECREAIRLRMDYADAHCSLGFGLKDKGLVDEAIAEYREALRIKSDDPWTHSNLGAALYAKGRLDEAIAECREAIRIKKDYATAHNNLGTALLGKGQVDEAIAEYREAIRLKKEIPEAHYNLGNALRQKGLVDEAIAEYQDAIRLKKDYPEAHSDLGNALRQKGLVDEAIAEYQDAIRLKKDYPEAYINLGAALYAKGQLDAAIAEYQEAIRLKKDYPAAHYNLGYALFEKGLLDAAIAEYQEAIRLKKDYPEAYINLGNALYAKGQLDAAIAEYQEAIRLKKDYPETYISLGCALFEKGLLDEAIAKYQEAIRLKKDSLEAHYDLGKALYAKGRLDDAIAEYRAGIRLKKDHPESHCGLGNVLTDKGRLDEAIAEYKEAIRLKRDYADAHYNVGNALRQKGLLDAAIAEYREAIRAEKDHPKAHCNLGLALWQQGELREALGALRRGHKLGSRNPRWPYPSAQWVRHCEYVVELDERLPGFLLGRSTPASPDERIGLAELCSLKRLHRSAARFYEEAFAAQPKLAEDRGAWHRYKAALAAALAGCGQGKDADKPDGEARARLRRQALGWLRGELEAWGRLLDNGPNQPRSAAAVTNILRHWQADPDLAGVRGPEALAKLPEVERQPWQKLWADTAEMLARAQKKTTTEEKGDAK